MLSGVSTLEGGGIDTDYHKCQRMEGLQASEEDGVHDLPGLQSTQRAGPVYDWRKRVCAVQKASKQKAGV